MRTLRVVAGRINRADGAKIPQFARKEKLPAAVQPVQPSVHFASVPPQMPSPRPGVGERGTQVVWGESHGEHVGGAGSFSASPSANPAGRRKRLLSCGWEP